MKLVNKNPNTTILLPGGCNASCDFCFWDKSLAAIRPPDNYFDQVFKHLAALPRAFKTLSISGGEPTISPFFGTFLTKLAAFRRMNPDKLTRVVLNTNGAALDRYLLAIGCVVDHINISRHAPSYEENVEIFKTKSIPTDVQLKKIISAFQNRTPCDVTLNCVIDDTTKTKFCKQYIEYAKRLGADAVCFRKVAGSLDVTKAERKFVAKYGEGTGSGCPVCRTRTQLFETMPVIWKASLEEPSEIVDGVYEAVIHPGGRLYCDWKGRTVLALKTKNTVTGSNRIFREKGLPLDVLFARQLQPAVRFTNCAPRSTSHC